MRIRNKAAASVAVVLGMALTLSACSSTGGAKATETSSSSSAADSGPASVDAGAGATVAAAGSYTVAMITHETPGDTFWDKIRSGAEAAAKKDGITLKYSNDPDATKQAALIQTAVSSKVDGIATTLGTPDALKASVQSAIAAKMPVVPFNSGINQYAAVGAMEYFGSDEDLAGNTVGT